MKIKEFHDITFNKLNYNSDIVLKPFKYNRYNFPRISHISPRCSLIPHPAISTLYPSNFWISPLKVS